MERIVHKKIEEALQSVNIVILVGQRQVGKTYEMKTLQTLFQNSLFFDFEDRLQREQWIPSLDRLRSIIGDFNVPKTLFFDEIQYLPEVGSVLKLLHDHFPKTQIIASGSASFLLLKSLGDSLYGRHIVIEMFPLQVRECNQIINPLPFPFPPTQNASFIAFWKGSSDTFLQYGSLPKIIILSNDEMKEQMLKNYVQSLLFKDIFEIEGIRKPAVFQKLLSLLALQIGSEVNPNELASQLNIDRKTVLEYIALYEKFYIIKTIRCYSQNERNEIKKGFKVYFHDLGIRNALLNDFSLPEYRVDRGALFENFVIMQYYQRFQMNFSHLECFYWRNTQHAEVDMVIVNKKTKKIIPIEIKYTKNTRVSKAFTNQYQPFIDEQYTITKENFWEFL